MKREHIKTFLIWMVVLNWPPLLWATQYDFLRLVCMLPYLFWINIPALWLGLAKLIGKPHYDIQEFGAMPLTAFSWVPIVAFWLLVARGLTVLTAYFPGFPGVHYQGRKRKETASNQASATSEPAPGADSSSHQG